MGPGEENPFGNGHKEAYPKNTIITKKSPASKVVAKPLKKLPRKRRSKKRKMIRRGKESNKEWGDKEDEVEDVPSNTGMIAAIAWKGNQTKP